MVSRCHWYDDSIASLELHPRILAALRKVKLSSLKSVLVLSAGDLVRRSGLSLGDVECLIAAASQAVCRQAIVAASALQLYKDVQTTPNHGRLSSGCVELDDVLRGGLVVPGINEIAGTSAAGKTQLCLQLCLTVQLPPSMGGLGGSAVYVSTEDAFPSKRWQQLAVAFAAKHRDLDLTANKLSNCLYIEHAATVSHLSTQLHYKLPSLLTQHPVRLVVIDSIAALFRVEYGAGQAIQRARLLREFGFQLQMLSEKHSAAIVCVNQVTAAMDSGSGELSAGVKPALGLTWADMVTTRLMLTRQEGVDPNQDFQQEVHLVPRTLSVLLAPHLPQTTLQYIIGTEGIESISSQGFKS